MQKEFISNFNLTSEQKKQFQDIRDRIDSVDDQLIDLLSKRTEIIKEAKVFKSSFYPEDKCYITSGREASMVKAIVSKTQNVGLPAEAIINIWRNIISSSTSLEKELSINTYLRPNEHDQLLDANNYFGSFAKIITADNIKEILLSTANTASSVAVVPYDSNWWLEILNNSYQLKIFACLPFITRSKVLNPSSAVIANILPEPTAEDVTLFVVKILNSNLTAIKEVNDKYHNHIVQTTADDLNTLYLVQQNGYFQIDETLPISSGNVTRNLNIGTFALPISIDL